MSVVLVSCPCGREIKAPNPSPGDVIRCLYCAGTQVYQPEGYVGPPAGSAGLSAGKPLMEYIKGLECRNCGGDFRIERKGADRFAVCRYCGTMIDLPETLGTTRERKEKGRDGSTVYEKVTTWQSFADQEPPDGLLSTPDSPLDGSVEINDETVEFQSLDEMARYLKNRLPEGEAEEILKTIRMDTGDGDFTTTTTVTSTTTTTGLKSETVKDGMLGRIGGWFRKK